MVAGSVLLKTWFSLVEGMVTLRQNRDNQRRNITNRWTGATGSEFRIIIGPAQLLGNAVARSTSMKPGRVKRKVREDCFTLLFEVIPRDS